MADIEVVAAKNGEPAARAAGAAGPLWLDSSYDPGRDAERRLAALEGRRVDRARVAVLLGDGLGYLASRLAARGLPVLVLEPDPDLENAARRARGAAVERVRWVAGAALPDVAAFAACLPAGTGPDGILVVEHEPTRRRFPDESARLGALVVSFARRGVADLATTARFGRRWCRNIVDNTRQTARWHRLAAAPGFQAVLAAPGPSLDGAVAALAAQRDRFLLAALAPAVRPLLTRGLVPDVVFASDGGHANGRHLDGLAGETRLRAVPLCFPFAAHAGLVRAWPGPLAPVAAGWPIERRLLDLARLPVQPEAPTVAVFALRALAALGAGRVVLAGQDLGTRGFAGHCRGYRFDEDAAARADRRATPEAAGAAPFTGRWERRGAWRASPQFVLYRDALLEAGRGSGPELVALRPSPFLDGIPAGDPALAGGPRPALVLTPVAAPLDVAGRTALGELCRDAAERIAAHPGNGALRDALAADPALAPVLDLLRPGAAAAAGTGEAPEALARFFTGLAGELEQLARALLRPVNFRSAPADT